ncbi:MAG: signal recognition particle receptor subunit alpha, partial [Eubacteriales bacterium]|nr:signal recognition particle receptor subunit alpha [Eubacteriales bacterium]
MEKKPLFQKWKTGLGKTRTGLLARLFASKDGINEAFYEELEEALILADAGAAVTEHLLDDLQVTIKEQKISDRAGAKKALAGVIAKAVTTQKPFSVDAGATVLLIVGVNGVGKTTSIGKLANSYREQGRRVMLAAADTFR